MNRIIRFRFRAFRWILLAGALLPLNAQGSSEGAARNGFDLSNVQVPISELRSGGVPRDGIPAILNPKFSHPDKASGMKADDGVLVFEKNGEVRGYPLPILNRHELVNDEVDGEPILVSYCPLCGTAMVFSRRIGDRILTFGVSGLLYNSDVLMYDHQTKSLWSQIGTRAIAGPLAGAKLDWMSSQQMKWSAWKAKYPRGKVLAPPSGWSRFYSQDPYAEYHTAPSPLFPVPQHRKDLPEKAWVLGVVVEGHAKAYPIAALAKAPEITDQIGNTHIKIIYDAKAHSAAVSEKATGEPIPQTFAYWFAWQAFHPETLIFSGR